MSDNGNGENEGMVHENKVAEWPDDIKAKIAQAKERFETFKAEMGCPNTDMVVYGTVVSFL